MYRTWISWRISLKIKNLPQKIHEMPRIPMAWKWLHSHSQQTWNELWFRFSTDMSLHLRWLVDVGLNTISLTYQELKLLHTYLSIVHDLKSFPKYSSSIYPFYVFAYSNNVIVVATIIIISITIITANFLQLLFSFPNYYSHFRNMCFYL